MQGVRRGKHLRAQAEKQRVQEMPSRQGRFDAAGSGGALRRARDGDFPHNPNICCSLERSD